MNIDGSVAGLSTDEAQRICAHLESLFDSIKDIPSLQGSCILVHAGQFTFSWAYEFMNFN